MEYALLVLIFILTAIYWLLTRTYDHWKKQNIPSVPNPLPGVGHVLPFILVKESATTFSCDVYKKYNHSVVGFYFMQKPGIVIRDPELVKSIMNTNFSSFKNNWIVLSEKSDPVLSKNPFFALDHQDWKDSRIRAITHLSGKNLKNLFVVVQDVCSKMSDYIGRNIEKTNNSLECELKEFFLRYTGEIVANSAFGIEGQSFVENSDKLAFVNVAKTIFEPTLAFGINLSMLSYLPELARLLNVSFLQKRADAYFRENLKAIVKQRKEMKIKPNDFLQLCIESNSERELDGIIADVIVFFFDTYETSSSALAAVFYHLSVNQDVQDKLRDHITSAIESNGNTVTYESLKNFNYLDQVINESLRMIPPLAAFMKVCTNDITLTGSDGLKCHLRPGDHVIIPIIAIHHDENYWTDPQVFDPDRFSPENQSSRNKNVFMPFGDGPRMCLGMRLGLMILRLAIISILTKYKVCSSSKTKTPLEIEPASIITYFKGGLWAKFEKLP